MKHSERLQCCLAAKKYFLRWLGVYNVSMTFIQNSDSAWSRSHGERETRTKKGGMQKRN